MKEKMTNSIKSFLSKIASSDYLDRTDRIPAIDIMGPQIQFLQIPEKIDSKHCIMLVSVPPGVTVPLHSHADPEFFFIIQGKIEMLNQDDSATWIEAEIGSFVQILPNAKHAFRNVSSMPAAFLCETTEQMRHFFETVGEAVNTGQLGAPPTMERTSRFVSAAERFGYWIGSPQENIAAGI